MARKTLLNEREIRKFLKLANITTVGDQKIHEMGGMPDLGGGAYERDDEDEEEVPMGLEPGEADLDASALDDEEVPVDDVVGDEEGDLGVGDMDTAGREELMADVVRAVADALGIADRVDVEAGEEETDLEDPVDDLEMDVDLGEPGPEAEMAPEEGGEELALGPEEEEPMMEEEEIDESPKFSEDDIVSEVARRVAARLQNESNKNQMVDALAERILKRLTK